MLVVVVGIALVLAPVFSVLLESYARMRSHQNYRATVSLGERVTRCN